MAMERGVYDFAINHIFPQPEADDVRTHVVGESPKM